MTKTTTSLTAGEAAQFLLRQDNFLLVTHVRPDGDTLGSAAALCAGLRQLHKHAWILDNPQLTPLYAPYVAGLTRPDVPEGAVCVAIDLASPGLIPENAASLSFALCLDHHGSNSGYAAHTAVQPDAAACGELIYEVLGHLHCTITKPMAEALYVALSSDTGCFRFSNVTANTLAVASALKAAGANTFSINEALFLTKRLSRLRLESYLTQSVEFFAGGAVAICQLPRQIRAQLDVSEDDLNGVSSFPQQIEGVQVGILLRELENGDGKISVRTRPGFDANALCAHMGGGGHPAAAGATVPGGMEAAKAAVLQALRREGITL